MTDIDRLTTQSDLTGYRDVIKASLVLLTARVLVGVGERSRKRQIPRTTRYASIERDIEAGGLLDYSKTAKRDGAEYPLRILLGTRGRIVLVTSSDRLVVYRGRELAALSTYVLAAYGRGSAYSTEAGLKYYRVGVVGSSRILYGRVRRYGTLGTLYLPERKIRRTQDIQDIHNPLLGFEHTISLTIGTARRFSVFRIKLGVVPMHRWVADVYEGAPSSSALYFAVLGKVPIRRVRIQLSFRIDLSYGNTLSILIEMRAAITIVRGAMVAVVQYRWKRRLAYSGIRNVGQIMIPRRFNTRDGTVGRRIYRLLYRRMTLLSWIARRSIRSSDREVKYRTERTGRSQENPVLARTLRRRAISRAGVPPIGGFMGKRLVYREAVEQGYRRLTRTGVRSGVVGAFNYLRRAKVSRFDTMVIDSNASSTLSAERTKVEGLALGSIRALIMIRLVYPMGRRDLARSVSVGRLG